MQVQVQTNEIVKPAVELSPPSQRRPGKKVEVCNEIIKRLRESGNQAVDSSGFSEALHAHFQRLPTRYALDVNVERAEDVLTHKNLLELAENPENCPAFHVRAVHVFRVGMESTLKVSLNNSSENEEDQHDSAGRFQHRQSVHPPPSFGSSPNLEALALDVNKPPAADEDRDSIIGRSLSTILHMPMHEVTFSTLDKPKLLSQLSSLLADIGLNIQEAHAFSTTDGYSLDVFVVDGWPTEDVQELQQALETAIAGTEEQVRSSTRYVHAGRQVLRERERERAALSGRSSQLHDHEQEQKLFWSSASPKSSPAEPKLKTAEVEFLRIPSDGSDDWEIAYDQLKFNQRVASGSFGELFRGTYCGQDVAIKILKPERLSEELQKEFAQEVYIMRKVRHKNVVQFIGACTRPPNLCIVTEFMSGGSVYDYLHNQRGSFKLPTLLRIAIDVSKGMDYLHQNNIIHRDLKAANLLMDEHEVVKVADFGVARVQVQSGIMTAETGTYRWMAPEVIEHKPYNRKADVFSFGILLWELLTGKLPYDYLTPLQAAVGVVQKGLRPTIPKSTHPRLSELLEICWEQDPAQRPEFSEISRFLQNILKEVGDEERKEKRGGFFSALKRNSR